MKAREPFNSLALKNKFPEAYREFFSRCQIVISSPHFFTWSGEYVGYFGGMMTLQKLPLRLYVGLEFYSQHQGGHKIEFSSENKSFSQKESWFVKDQYDHLTQGRLTNFLNQNIKLPAGEAIKIHLFSEVPFGGSGSTGALCSGLAVAFALADKTIHQDNLTKWGQNTCCELLADKKYKFNTILRMAWKMQAIMRGKESTGATILACLLDSQYPIFYQAKHQNQPPANGDYSFVDKVEFQAGRLNEIFDLNHHHSWPIDFGLIYLGEPRGTMPYTTEQLQDEMKESDSFCHNTFPEGALNNNLPAWQGALKVMNFLSCQILYQLGQVLKSGSREDSLRALLRAIDKHQVLFMLLGVLPGSVDSVTSIVHHQARKIDELSCGLKSVSTTKKDILLFALPQGRLRDLMIKILPKLEKELGINLQLGYVSWLDGLEERACLVEQYLAEGVYSDFISKNAIFIKEVNGQGRTNKLILSPEDFNQKKNQVDILVEEGSGKILIKGELLSSKEIHSSKATAEVLKVLAGNHGQNVSNRSLPESSYASDRYEMQGKIIYPLTKVFEQKTKKKLSITIKGSITDFTLRLEAGDYIIWIKE